MSKIYRMLGPDGLAPCELTPEGPKPASGLAEHLLVPGFVDLHVHGGFGEDLMRSDAAGMGRWFDGLRQKGYEGILATTVTAPAAAIRAALSRLPEDPFVLGVHLEGPFISPTFPGAQPKEAILPAPDGPGEWDDLLDHPRLKLVTMAPEIPGGLGTIRRLVARGVVVSMGHTNATYGEAQAGFRAGARHTTHTFNAMRGMHHREAGTVGFALTEDGLSAELIYDRIHVCREVASVLVRAKPADRLIAVSDGTLAVGLPPGRRVAMWGHDCIVGDGDVRLLDGTLAGSAISLLEAFRNLASDFGEEVAIRACCLNPRAAIGLATPPKVWVELDHAYEIVALHPA